MIYDSIENIGSYGDQADAISKAVRFVRDFDRALPDGKYEIDGGDIFALVQSVRTGTAKEKLFEAHRIYIDVQMVLEGWERQDVILLDSEDIAVSQEYEREKDLMLFEEPQHYSTIIMKPGMFVVYGPGDGHRPGCSMGEPQDIRKVCVKIKL